MKFYGLEDENRGSAVQEFEKLQNMSSIRSSANNSVQSELRANIHQSQTSTRNSKIIADSKLYRSVENNSRSRQIDKRAQTIVERPRNNYNNSLDVNNRHATLQNSASVNSYDLLSKNMKGQNSYSPYVR